MDAHRFVPEGGRAGGYTVRTQAEHRDAWHLV